MSGGEVSEDDILHLRKLVEAHKERLRILELRAATSGLETPPQIQIEIDTIKRQIETLEQQLSKNSASAFTKSKALLEQSSRNLASVERRLASTEKKIRLRDVAIYLIVLVIGVAGFLLGRLSVLGMNGLAFSPRAETLSIESIPSSVFAFGGEDDPDVKKGSAQLTVVIDQDSHRNYKLDYNIPEEGDGYADLAFQFSEPQDFSGYSFVEITISFEGENDECFLLVDDAYQHRDTLVLGSDNLIQTEQNKRLFRVDLGEFFKNTAGKSIIILQLGADPSIAGGEHAFTVSKIEFRK